MHTHEFPAIVARLGRVSRRSFLAAAAALVIGGTAPAVIAAPGVGDTAVTVLAQNVDWLSADQAAYLDAGIEVLVPSSVPAPFDSVAPSLSAADGYYELYWMIPGGPPTFLQISGIAGGSLPAGSPADLNKQLFVNASVQGSDAIHDIGVPAGATNPIYDQVWWIANGVLYTVSSLNMTGSDSLSLANALIPLDVPVAPAEEEPAPADPEPVVEPTAPPSDGGSDSEADHDDPPATSDEGETVAQESVVSETTVAQEPVVSEPTAAQPSDEAVSESASEEDVSVLGTDASALTEVLDGVGGNAGPLPSDGTDGPQPPIFGSDGTGGVKEISLPRDVRGR